VKLNDLKLLLEQDIAPVALSDEFCKRCNAYDNSGIIIDGGDDINGILFTLELSPKVVQEALRLGVNAIVTHHPAIYGGIKNLLPANNPQAYSLTQCVKCGISVISMHLNFDAAPHGIDHYLMHGIGGEQAKLMIELSSGGYGRVYNIKSLALGKLAERLKTTFRTQRLLVYGNCQKVINRAASFCGAGCDDQAMAFAVENNADVFVSSDIKHHQLAELEARGLGVIILTHYSSEAYGFNQIYQKLKNKLSVPSSFYWDEGLL
jgi:dinuclear metal center YbgI/SA1388 family protein